MFYKFIKIKNNGGGGKYIGYAVPRMYRLDFNKYELRLFGFQFIKERMNGWTIWWVENEEDYKDAITILKELKNDIEFDYKVSC